MSERPPKGGREGYDACEDAGGLEVMVPKK